MSNLHNLQDGAHRNHVINHVRQIKHENRQTMETKNTCFCVAIDILVFSFIQLIMQWILAIVCAIASTEAIISKQTFTIFRIYFLLVILEMYQNLVTIYDGAFCENIFGKKLHYRYSTGFQILLRKKCLYLELFWSVFSRMWTEYGEI